MAREINLDGTEITIIKAIGTSGSDVDGHTVIERCQNFDFAEIVDTLKGLISIGYVDADSHSFRDMGAFEKVHFRVNPGWSKDLRNALDPQPEPQKSKRVRRQ